MYGDNPTRPPTDQAVAGPEDATGIQSLLNELDSLEAMAVAAQPTEVRHFGWAGLSSDSGLTEAQEDFVDHWSPQRVLVDCQAKRALLIAARTWAEPLSEAGTALDRLLRTAVTGQAS